MTCVRLSVLRMHFIMQSFFLVSALLFSETLDIYVGLAGVKFSYFDSEFKFSYGFAYLLFEMRTELFQLFRSLYPRPHNFFIMPPTLFQRIEPSSDSQNLPYSRNFFVSLVFEEILVFGGIRIMNFIRILSGRTHQVHLFIHSESRDRCQLLLRFRKPLSRIIVFSLSLMCKEIEKFLIRTVQSLKTFIFFNSFPIPVNSLCFRKCFCRARCTC
jgi:hypothetical protein